MKRLSLIFLLVILGCSSGKTPVKEYSPTPMPDGFWRRAYELALDLSAREGWEIIRHHHPVVVVMEYRALNNLYRQFYPDALSEVNGFYHAGKVFLHDLNMRTVLWHEIGHHHFGVSEERADAYMRYAMVRF